MDENTPANLTPAAPPDRSPRQQVLLGVEIAGFGGGAPSRHRLKDLSTTGARIDRAGRLKPGSTVLVSVGVLEAVGATVIWVRDDAAGLEFAQPIDPGAARSRTIVSSNVATGSGVKAAMSIRAAKPATSAGWVGGMRNPYGR